MFIVYRHKIHKISEMSIQKLKKSKNSLDDDDFIDKFTLLS